MKKLLIILPLLVACKSSKWTCDANSELTTSDTVVISADHIHIESEHKCMYFPGDTVIINDTFIIKTKN